MDLGKVTTSLDVKLGKSEKQQHLIVLDFLRGIAALCVVLFHFSTRVNINGLFWHGYLAVDFFFCLSGYVICVAYSKKLETGQIQTIDFFVARIIRFLPLVLLGNVVAAALDLFRAGNFSFAQHAEDVLVTLVISSFLLPVFWKTSLEDSLYPLNGPVWSLFFEMFANIFYALIVKLRHSSLIMVSIVFLSFVTLINVSLKHGDIHVGPHASSFFAGFARVSFSFFLGVLIAKCPYGHNNVSKWMYAFVVCFTTAVPKIESIELSSCYDMLVITIIFPLVIIGAAHCGDNRKKSALAVSAGEMSYPIYCLHYALVRVFSTWIRGLSGGAFTNLVLTFLSIGGMAVLSLGAFIFYDKPARRKIASLVSSNWLADLKSSKS